METTCDYCGDKKAVETCEVCSSQVCANHKKEHGCTVCGGGVMKFE